jgi:hypothetical protein
VQRRWTTTSIHRAARVVSARRYKKTNTTLCWVESTRVCENTSEEFCCSTQRADPRRRNSPAPRHGATSAPRGKHAHYNHVPRSFGHCHPAQPVHRRRRFRHAAGTTPTPLSIAIHSRHRGTSFHNACSVRFTLIISHHLVPNRFRFSTSRCAEHGAEPSCSSSPLSSPAARA